MRAGAATPPVRSTGDTAPRAYLFEDQFTTVWDQRLIAGGNSRLPAWWRLARAVHERRDEYDAIVTWGERLSLALMAVDWLAGGGKPHIPIITQFAKPNIEYPMRLFGGQLHAAICLTSVQSDYAVAHRLIDTDRLFRVRYLVDTQFYRPMPGAGDLICSVGAEMRDYATLFAALDGTELRCHVAADVVRIPGRLRLVKDRRVRVEELQPRPNPLLTIQRRTLPELRELYARSRFVVVPLLPSRSDNGITVVLEAMAMGKAVICSATEGQVDVIEDGVTGIFVPPGDPVALRNAMLSLWNDPERARAIGARGREYVERVHTLEGFCANVSSAIDATLDGVPAPSTWWVADDGARMPAAAGPIGSGG